MSKKKINIVLILIVLGLWGTVIYRSLNHYFFPDQNIVTQAETNSRFNYKQIKKDSFELLPLAHDPFLKNSLNSPSPSNSNSFPRNASPKSSGPKKPAVIREKVPVVLYWPEINYYGYIKSSLKTEEMILIKVDNKLYKARKKDNVGGVVIKRIFKDSIEMSFKKENKFIYLKH